MKIFVFDTETTGFINKKELDLEKQPKIIQFAGIIGEIIGNKFIEEKRINILINPKMPIPYASSQVHHIYDIDVKNAPFIEDVIEDIIGNINGPDIIIGHNIEYDEDMVKLELKRLNVEYKYKPKQKVCTMKSTVDFCKIEGNGNRFKYPKLGELHKILFGEYFIGAHDAMVDVEATLRCFVELVNQKVVKIEVNKDEVMSLF
ncbi:MAG: 3'-5' exonuclease [Candidatus Gracilibacteria bacterium]|nr:3'-5' exonuclease [Candidatus Gracilibacteria bacterium]